jgi:hypothetical protein
MSASPAAPRHVHAARAVAAAVVLLSGAARAAEADLVLPAPKDLAAAVEAVQRATGVQGGRLETEETAEIPLAEGRSFALESSVADRLLAGSHAAFRKAGVYLFRYERSYGLPGEKDRVGLLATSDPEVVMRRIGTVAHRRKLTTDQIVKWLRQLAKDEPFELHEIGVDYVAGRFDRAPKDPVAIAHRFAEFAPDLVAGHSNPIDGLADAIGRKRSVFLIWD